MSSNPRRIVTGNDVQGRSLIVSNLEINQLPSKKEVSPLTIIDLWETETSPAPLNVEDSIHKKIALVPPPHGTIFRLCDFLPESTYKSDLTKIDVETAWTTMTEGDLSQVKTHIKHSPHPFMHQTQTIDYGIVLSGQIYLILDTVELLLNPGDVVIQRGTSHFWSNRSDKICRMAFILLDATKT